jgi:RNA polymerase sigma-70 factor (ECF subfamily)
LGCYAPLYRYARSLCGDAREAEELLQETYKRALAAKRKPAAANTDEMRPWMFTIMRNVWHNERRRLWRSRETRFEEELLPRSVADTEFGMNRRLLVSEVRAAVDSLPVIWREIIVMRDMEDLSYAEIAAIVGCPVGTVMSRLARAREALRQSLAPRVAEARPEVRRW